MVRARHVVAHRFRRMMADKNCASIADREDQVLSRGTGKLQMLRRQRVDQGRRFLPEAGNEKNRAMVLPALAGNAAARHGGNLALDGRRRGLRKGRVVRYQNSLGCYVVLGLSKKIGG